MVKNMETLQKIVPVMFYSISIVFKNAFIFTRSMSLDRAIQKMDEENAIMAEIYNGKHWKSPKTAFFSYNLTKKAELFASAIVNSHGIQPTIIFLPDGIQIQTPGYSC